MTNSPVGTRTSMSDHNIIQIETNMKIIEEKQNCQIKKSNLSYRDLILFNEDISWASIDADLLNTSWDMLLTDVKTDEIYNIINICLEICQKYVLPKKNSRKHQISTVYLRIYTVYLSKFLRSIFECKVDRRNVFISFPISYGCWFLLFFIMFCLKYQSPGTYVIEWVSRGHFCLALCFFGPPSHSLVVITWRGEGYRYMMWLG